MDRPPLTETDLLRWAEALAGIARTGLGFTESLYERERFEEVLAIAADIRQHTSLGIDHEAQVDEWLKGVGKGVPGYVTPKVAIGGHVVVSFALRSTARAAQDLLVDLAVHFVKASGRAAPKVFKLQRIELPARGRAELAKKVSLAVHTTRKPRPGRHVVEVLVNGVPLPAGSFEVVEARARRKS